MKKSRKRVFQHIMSAIKRLLTNCWVNVECPDNDDFKFLTEELKVPESFLEDIADVDERPRTETEDNWLLTILRIPMPSNQRGVPFITVPIGIITNDGIIVRCV